MPKAWKDMSADEKADWLADELERLGNFANRISLRVGEIAKRVEVLEASTQTAHPSPH